MERSQPQKEVNGIPELTIVFTGQYDRIYKGVELLSSGASEKLFISGANKKAGIHVDRFARQFQLTPEQQEWINTEKIVLAADARDTLENAWEASCWIDGQNDVKAVALITSQRHMARASVALEHAIAPVEVVRIMSDASENYEKYRLDLVEFGKFVATWGITFLPYDLWPSNTPGICLRQ
jgi:uncharacterized SAM-binding protein YcdF (DUF218 family)